MSAAKKKTTPFPTTRYRRKDLVVDAIEGAAVLLAPDRAADYPAGVTLNESGAPQFQGFVIRDTDYLVYDELGTPLSMFDGEEFKATFDVDMGAKGNDALKGDIAQAHTMIKKLEDQVIDLDATVEQERAKHNTTIESNRRLRELVELMAPALGINIDDYATREDLVKAIQEAAAGRAAVAPPAPVDEKDSALGVLRGILKIEPAQTRDDGGRIIHLNKAIIDRALALL